MSGSAQPPLCPENYKFATFLWEITFLLPLFYISNLDFMLTVNLKHQIIFYTLLCFSTFSLQHFQTWSINSPCSSFAQNGHQPCKWNDQKGLIPDKFEIQSFERSYHDNFFQSSTIQIPKGRSKFWFRSPFRSSFHSFSRDSVCLLWDFVQKVISRGEGNRILDKGFHWIRARPALAVVSRKDPSFHKILQLTFVRFCLNRFIVGTVPSVLISEELKLKPTSTPVSVERPEQVF